MVTTRTSPLKRFPELLKLRPTKELSEHERRHALHALLEHYELKNEFDAVSGHRRKTFARAHAEAVLFAKLARCLVSDFVPVFGAPRGRAGRRKQSEVVGHSFGGLLITPGTVARYYQAELVDLVNQTKAKKQRSQAWVLRWLTQPKNRICLPLLYRNLKTAKSLNQAFKSVPKPIRDNPASYLPRSSFSDSSFLSFNLGFSPNHRTGRGLLG